MEILPPISDEDKMLSGLSYPLWPIAPPFVLLSSKRRDPFLQFHALQGLGYGVAASFLTVLLSMGIWVLFQILPSGSTFVAGFLGIAIFCAGLAAFLVLFLSSLFLGWRASAGEMIRLPVIGEWAEARVVQETGADLAHYDPYQPARVVAEAEAEPVAPASANGPFSAAPDAGDDAFGRGPARPLAPTAAPPASARIEASVRRQEQRRSAFGPNRPAPAQVTGPQVSVTPEAGLLKQWLSTHEEEEP